MESTLYRRGRHCIFNMHVHLVFVTKYRKNIFTKSILDSMKSIFVKVCQDFHDDIEIVEFDGEKDHVHLLLHYHPKVSISKLVNSLKGVSSRLLKQQHPELERYYWQNALWSPSYFAASCGGAPIDIVRKYIEQQNTPS